jgi:hypothetical protein
MIKGIFTIVINKVNLNRGNNEGDEFIGSQPTVVVGL